MNTRKGVLFHIEYCEGRKEGIFQIVLSTSCRFNIIFYLQSSRSMIRTVRPLVLLFVNVNSTHYLDTAAAEYIDFYQISLTIHICLMYKGGARSGKGMGIALRSKKKKNQNHRYTESRAFYTPHTISQFNPQIFVGPQLQCKKKEFRPRFGLSARILHVES